ncbi:MAG: esterase family protein [Chitinophagaceae bacterium]|nr:esterase family protein [Chitinophagaceae bacterium]
MVVKQKKSGVFVEKIFLESEYLGRTVTADVYFPAGYQQYSSLELLLINDGQDLVTMEFENILDELWQDATIEPLIAVGIHCGPERKMEYGIVYRADYMGRGAKAGLYSKFIFDELLPCLRSFTGIRSFAEKSFAGFSLGALSALDIAWNHATEFTKAGIFSGALWWRRKDYADGYDENTDRLMHLQVQLGQVPYWMKFFFQCGTDDEKEDRNNNGVIDSIDDAKDLIELLKQKGLPADSVYYYEIAGGKHNIETWAKAWPEFLKWGWGKSNFEH